jgi:hypothetical protein
MVLQHRDKHLELIYTNYKRTIYITAWNEQEYMLQQRILL